MNAGITSPLSRGLVGYFQKMPRYVVITSKSVGVITGIVSSWFYAQERDKWEKYPRQKAIAATLVTGGGSGLFTAMLLRHPLFAFGVVAVTIAARCPPGPIVGVVETETGRPPPSMPDHERFSRW